MLRWWPEQNFTIAHGDGIFEHAHLDTADSSAENDVDDGNVRVCFVHHALWVGGVERQIRLIVDGINRCVAPPCTRCFVPPPLIPTSLNSSKVNMTFRMILFTELGEYNL